MTRCRDASTVSPVVEFLTAIGSGKRRLGWSVIPAVASRFSWGLWAPQATDIRLADNTTMAGGHPI
ncbi:hypothetical protein BOTBODRAFT_526219, partial [Botryobasidium botryosum FD-172 SS1]